MTLRNAFDGLATESGLRRIANLLTFARDAQDRIRVQVDAGTINNAVVYNRASSTNMTADNGVLYNGALSWNVVDARDPLKMSYAQRADFVKRNRWTY